MIQQCNSDNVHSYPVDNREVLSTWKIFHSTLLTDVVVLGSKGQRSRSLEFTSLGTKCSRTDGIRRSDLVKTSSISRATRHELSNLQVALLSQRPRDDSYLSVVYSTKRRALLVTQATDLLLRAMLFCCLWRNVETSCHKHFVVVFRYQQTPPLTASDKCHNLRDRGPAASC